MRYSRGKLLIVCTCSQRCISAAYLYPIFLPRLFSLITQVLLILYDLNTPTTQEGMTTWYLELTSFHEPLTVNMTILSSGFLLSLASSLLYIVDVCTASPATFREIATIKRSASDIAESYDYVIVGGGTSGLTVADRLTEDGTSTQAPPSSTSGPDSSYRNGASIGIRTFRRRRHHNSHASMGP